MPIKVTCSCGKSLQVDEKHRGKKIKCPECGAAVIVPEASTAAQAETPRKRRDANDLDSRGPAGADKKSTAVWWLAGAGCAVMALCTCGLVIGGGGWVSYRAAEQARFEERKKVKAMQEAEQARIRAEKASNRARSANNLKEIALAMHGYHDTYKGLPNGALPHTQTGQPILSWRVALLPFVGEAVLAQEIRMNERWDSEHNKKFWNRMPRVYQLPGKPYDEKTYYQVFRGNETVFPDLPIGNRLRILQITDGASNTILCIEAAEPINWMKPDDIPFRMNQPDLTKYAGNHWDNDSFNVAFGDGMVRSLKRTMPALTLQALVTRAGGEVINWDECEVRR